MASKTVHLLAAIGQLIIALLGLACGVLILVLAYLIVFS